MKVAELISEDTLTEETLQSILKRSFQPAGTLNDLLGKDATNVAKMLQCKPSDKAFVIRPESPKTRAVMKALTNSRASDDFQSQEHGDIRLVRMIGGARVVLVSDDYAVTSEHMRGQLVEEQDLEEGHGIYSSKKKEQEPIRPGIVKKLQKKAPKTANGKKPLER